MERWCERSTRDALDETLREILERNSDSLSNVLVVGSDNRRREVVARMFHSASFRNGGVFTLLKCNDETQSLKDEFLGLVLALTRDGECERSRNSEVLSGGTLFIDDVEQMDPENQRLCLEFLKQLQRLKNERPGAIGLRVVAGVGCDLSQAITQGGFLPSLLDLLDKVRVELDVTCERESQSQLPKSMLIGA